MKINQTITLILFLFTSVYINAQGFTIKDYDIEVQLETDNSCFITEKILVNFYEERRGIFRDIPSNTKLSGQNKSVKLTDVSINGFNYKILRENNNYRIRIGDKDKFLTGDVLYTIEYRLQNIYLLEKDHTEFQYNLIANWDVPIEKVTYTLRYPNNYTPPFNEYQIVSGEDNAQEKNATIEWTGTQIKGESLAPLKPQENITIFLKLDKELITRPAKPVPLFKRDKFWIIPIGFIIWLLSFFKSIRKEEPLGPVTDVYYPPSNMSPAEVGAYHDYKVHIEDLLALLPYWAQKGYIKIMSNGMTGDDHDIYFQKLELLDKDAPDHEHTIFDAIFKDEDLVLLSEMKYKMSSAMYKASNQIKKRLIDKELYDEGYLQMFGKTKMILLGFFTMLTGILLTALLSLVITGVALAVFGLTMFIMAFFEPKRSFKGIKIKHELEGLKQFLRDDKANRTADLLKRDEYYFETLYPYAIALGLDKSWMNRIETFEMDYAPYWYVYHDPMMHSRRPNMSDFNKDFSIPEIKSVFTSVQASSTSGGSGGGGFSGGSAGGGFGGGGGSW